MPDIQVYQSAYFDGVKSLWEEAFPNDPPWNRPEVAIPEKLAFQPDLFLVALDGVTVIGTTVAGYDGTRGWLYSVAVRATSRRRGIGTALIRAAEVRLRAKGCSKINLQVRAANRAVAAFYEHIGYALDDTLGMGKRLAG